MQQTSDLRMTRQRQVILDTIRHLHTHPTADEVHLEVRKMLPRVSLATVYRNLEVLSEKGFIQKLELSGAQKRFDGTVEKHYHVRCTRCGRTDDLHLATDDASPLEAINGLDEIAGEVSGYKVENHRLEFLGVCPDCLKKTRNSGSQGNH